MTKTLVNVTLIMVNQELETILETYPNHPHQEAFSHPDIRQCLIAYILNRIPNHYITVDQEAKDKVFTNLNDLWHSIEHKLHIEAIIHQGIEKVLCEQAQEVNRHIPEVANPSLIASDWFG
ncbi:late competence development ComFB family protein [Nostoc sp. CCY0012]|uniref:late competence development ComFB family protein n=1 Tax=Nostoc sp. CCY0012 TaxID=1056123 RepID=UPI0039C5E90C